MLELRHIQAGYGAITILNDVSLQVASGSIVALIGSNGNGKSTTLRAIAGLNRLTQGEILYHQQKIHLLPAHQKVQLGVVLVPEGRRLFPKLSVLKNLQLGAFTRTHTDEVLQDIENIFTLFPILRTRAHQLAGTMSGGEQQMLAIGRGLMSKPNLLMLDEPTWGIAPKFVHKVMEVIQSINQSGVSILLVEQNVHKALQIADYVYVMQGGRIILQGKPEDLQQSEDIKKAYLGI